MRAGAVQLAADIVAGAVGKVVGKTGLANDVARGIVGLKATDGTAGCEG